MITMKKLISIALVAMMIFALATASASALNSPYTVGKYKVSVDVEGSGSVSGSKNSVDISDPDENGNITLTATDKDGYFTKWIIDGTYEIISGDLYSPEFVIKPTSDVKAVASFSVEKDYLTITVKSTGDGSAAADPTKVKKGSGDTVTLTATEKNDPFIKWELACDYEIVDGSLTSKTLVIKPLTDVNVTAVFGSDNAGTTSAGTNTGSTSPATGDYSVMMIALVLMALGLGAFAVKKIKD